MRSNGITYVLNVSKTCTKPEFIHDSHFHRISVHDSYQEKMTPHITEAIEFIGELTFCFDKCVCIFVNLWIFALQKKLENQINELSYTVWPGFQDLPLSRLPTCYIICEYDSTKRTGTLPISVYLLFTLSWNANDAKCLFLLRGSPVFLTQKIVCVHNPPPATYHCSNDSFMPCGTRNGFRDRLVKVLFVLDWFSTADCLKFWIRIKSIV